MNRYIILIFSFVVLLGIGASWVINKANSSHDIPIIKPVPDFSFKNQFGSTFNETNLKNKITVLDFIFTTCPGPCPIMTYNMVDLYHDFDSVSEVQFVSITVDPEMDTKEILKEYADLNGVDDQRWHFLYSDIDSIKKLKKEGFMLYADKLPQGHAIKFILIDHNGNIRKYFDGTDEASMKILRKDLTKLVKKIRS